MDAAVADISFGHFENAEQIAFWNGAGGERWVARRAELDAMLAPVQAALLERAAIQPGERVLDIGCGCGATLIAAAEQAGPGGTVLGLDVSAAMLTCAHELAPADAPVSFVQGDAMVHHFKAASADLVLSRLGVMYFADPVRAILNIRNALRSEGRVAFACWESCATIPGRWSRCRRPMTTCRSCPGCSRMRRMTSPSDPPNGLRRC